MVNLPMLLYHLQTLWLPLAVYLLAVSYTHLDVYKRQAVPLQNPFGGQGLTYTTITAHFLDSNYFLNFGRIHTGMDLVPNETYYKTSKTYKETNQVVIFSTINGTARYFIDQYGSETVEVINTDQTARVAFLHLSKVLVSGGTIKAGTAIGLSLIHI